MKGRAVLALAAIALLVIPLAGLAILWFRSPPEQVVEGWRFAPWLSPAEARERPTLLQPCQGDEQCDPPFVCFHDPRIQQRQCTGTGCESDSWCPPETACRAIPLRGRDRMALRTCAHEGMRKEGERCLRFVQWPMRERACGQGLVCAVSGWCGRRCVPGKEGTCAEGFFCSRGDPDGPLCQPTCEGRTCPEGQECVRWEGGVSVCLVVYGRSCHDDEPCPEGTVCEMEPLLTLVGQARRSCVRTCGLEGAESCLEGFVCHQGRCRPRCSLTRPDSCGTRFCVSTDDEGNGVCLSSPEQWDMAVEPARDGG
ncbi:hypothetical protein Q664_34625 [Archangium violaceum Cb vi76]|uniref:Uncharacterized protein n=1 Tax=Archangium violaceum Cb vi76 TaxID=1406225 RepID=A0A084SM27_9BACT|nr:hypothetical protein Q664_34625 [Archangium violaceum Cb vi76]